MTIVNGFIEGGVTNNSGTFEGPGFGAGINCESSGSAANVLVHNKSHSPAHSGFKFLA